MLTGSKEWIDSNFERLVYHLGDQPLQKNTWLRLQAWIGIDLDQLKIHVIVDHEV